MLTIRGSVDVVTTKGATGWAYAQGRRNEIVVQALLSHEVIGDAIATDHRPDLAAVGMGKGNCGYTIEFYREIDPLYLPFVSIKVDGGDTELPRAGELGFREFFAALHRSRPTAGRSRSVLGGLWSDRTDAAAILKAKNEIGQLDSKTAAIVGQLIHLGLAIVDLPAGPAAEKHENGITPNHVATLVEAAPMLNALRAVFDDNPLILSAELCEQDTTLVQPSAENALTSAVECLAVASPVGEDSLAVEIVRDSHLLPEFTAGGVSRWASGQVHAALLVATERQGLISRYEIPPGGATIIGPGTIYRLRCTDGGAAMKLFCLPTRLMPLTLVHDVRRRETVRESGVRIWL
jgi:hypothetical protein